MRRSPIVIWRGGRAPRRIIAAFCATRVSCLHFLRTHMSHGRCVGGCADGRQRSDGGATRRARRKGRLGQSGCERRGTGRRFNRSPMKRKITHYPYLTLKNMFGAKRYVATTFCSPSRRLLDASHTQMQGSQPCGRPPVAQEQALRSMWMARTSLVPARPRARGHAALPRRCRSTTR